MTKIKAINERNMTAICRELAASDERLAFVHRTYGTPPLWARPKGFATLLNIILEQQVSLASAKACFDKLDDHLGDVTPDRFLTVNDADLKTIGFSRQKTNYVRCLANAIVTGSLDVDALATMPDPQVRSELVALKGIGPWSAEIYLLMALRRADAWPAGDLALQVAAQTIKGLPARPDPAALNEIAESWRPWRAVAARLLWHHYLSKPAAFINSQSTNSQ